MCTVSLPSHHALYSLVPLPSRVTFLKSYLVTCAGWYISRGNSVLPIKDFYNAAIDRFTAPPAAPVLPSVPRKPLMAPGGPWERIIMNTVANPDEHLSKAVSSLCDVREALGRSSRRASQCICTCPRVSGPIHRARHSGLGCISILDQPILSTLD